MNDNESHEILDLYADTIGDVYGYGQLNSIESNDVGSHIFLGDVSKLF